MYIYVTLGSGLKDASNSRGPKEPQRSYETPRSQTRGVDPKLHDFEDPHVSAPLMFWDPSQTLRV